MVSDTGSLLAVSDLHIAHPDNRKLVEDMRPSSDRDWLIVAGDIAENTDDIGWALATLKERFAEVIWVPGNHELWTPRQGPSGPRGVERYRLLVELCRELGVLTPEDPYPVWRGGGGPAVIAPLFLLYDYSFLAPGASTAAESLAVAYRTGVVCSDEFLLHPDPYPDRASWCAARVEETERRLQQCPPGLPTVLVNHYPLVREPTRILFHPEFAQWCGTERTADWHLRFRAACVVYGHLHIPRTTWYDGVRFEEVSVGYPREWQRSGHPNVGLRRILPEDPRRGEWS